MSETLTSNVNLSLAAVLSGSNVLSTTTSNLNLTNLLAAAFASGTGAGNINQLYSEQNNLSASASKSYDLYAFGGALDPLGNAYTLSAVKLLIVQILGNANYYYATAASVHSGGGGSGYSVGDVLTITGGGVTSVDCTVVVATVSSGAVTGITLVSAGAYSASPSTSANATTGGKGTGCTLDLTFATGTNAAYGQFTDTDYLVIGNQNDSTCWTSMFNGSITAAVKLFSGTKACPGFMLGTTGGAGWAVVNTTNYKLKITNGGANRIDYNIIVLGST